MSTKDARRAIRNGLDNINQAREESRRLMDLKRRARPIDVVSYCQDTLDKLSRAQYALMQALEELDE